MERKIEYQNDNGRTSLPWQDYSETAALAAIKNRNTYAGKSIAEAVATIMARKIHALTEKDRESLGKAVKALVDIANGR